MTAVDSARPSAGVAELRALRLGAYGLALLVALVAGLLAPAGAVAEACPNEEIREGQGVEFPGCMALEQVSPPRKDNQGAKIYWSHIVVNPGPVGAFSSDGSRIVFKSQGTLGGAPAFNNYTGDEYIATRDGEEGWGTSYTTAPDGLIRGWTQYPSPAAISADLSRWFQMASTLEQSRSGLGQMYRGGLGGEFVPFSPFLTPLSGTPTGPLGNVQFDPTGASADGSRVYFTADTTITYMPDDPSPAGSGAVGNTYIAQLDSDGDPSLGLLARDGAGTAWGGNCGASVAGGQDLHSAARDRGAISVDGSRTYFTTRPGQPGTGGCDSASHKKRIMVREESVAGVEISELFVSECNRAADLPAVPGCGTAGPSGTALFDADDVYEGASVDGSKVYFTTSRQLTDSDVNGLDQFGSPGGCGGFSVGGCDLYLFDASKPEGARLTQVTAGSSGQAAPSVATISGDGSRVYFNSSDVLTADPGPGTGTAQPGQNNLYLYDTESGELSFIANTNAGSAYPVPVLGPDPEVLGVGGDGHLLFFTSSAALTADDSDGTGVDIFRYDAEDETLVRVSKAAPGGSDNGPFDVLTNPRLGTAAEGGYNAPYLAGFARWVSEDGQTLGFKTNEGLVPGDDNGITDSYAVYKGELFRLPGTTDTLGTHPLNGLQDRPMVSLDGNTVAFQTYRQLLPSDGDTAIDVYVARVNGGFPELLPDQGPCDTLAGACQGDGAAPAAADRQTDDAGDGNASPGIRARLVAKSPGQQARRRAARAGVIRLRVRVNRSASVRALAKARIRVGKGLVVRQVSAARLRFAQAGTRVLALKLNEAATRRLARGERLRVQIRLTIAGANGRTVTVTLKRGNDS